MTRETFWFIGDFDQRTNETLSQLIPAENCQSQVLCQDGKKRDLWQTDYATITRFKKAKASAYLVFEVFKRDGQYGPVVKYDFPKRITKERRRISELIRERNERKDIARQKRKDKLDAKKPKTVYKT